MNNLVIVMVMRNRKNRMLRIRRTLRDTLGPFSVTENEFRRFHRLSREAVRALIIELRPFLPNLRQSHGVAVELQVLIALHFFASCSYQARVGKNYSSCVSQPEVSKILCNVVNALHIVVQDWIQFRIEEAEIQRVEEMCWVNTQFPGVIGAVGGTHVAIVPPKTEREHIHINRELYHSLNVLTVSDYESKVLSVNAAHGRRTHDSRVQQASRVSIYLQEMYVGGRRDAWLIGDSGYPLLPYLMTPKPHEPEGSPPCLSSLLRGMMYRSREREVEVPQKKKSSALCTRSCSPDSECCLRLAQHCFAMKTFRTKVLL